MGGFFVIVLMELLYILRKYDKVQKYDKKLLLPPAIMEHIVCVCIYVYLHKRKNFFSKLLFSELF